MFNINNFGLTRGLRQIDQESQADDERMQEHPLANQLQARRRALAR